jgi:lipid-binding SYLF domain-containing protein
MNDHGMKSLLNSKFKLGADASVAAGPVGRQAEGSTDITMRAEILTYSRARGIFAGVTLNGASVRQDRDATRDFYGRMVNYRTLLQGGKDSPESAQPWITALNRYAGGATTNTAPAATRERAPANPPANSTPTESDIPANPPAPSTDPH